MKKRIILIFAISLFLLCIGFFLILEYSKVGSHPIKNIRTLAVEITDFPIDWKEIYFEPIPKRSSQDWGEENIMKEISLEPEKGFSYQLIYRFNNEFTSIVIYPILYNQLILFKEDHINFLNFKSEIADSYNLGCIKSTSGGVICEVLARYADYIVYFSISAKGDNLTPKQLEKILQSIDNRMANMLSK